MLVQMYVKDFVLIDNVNLEFHTGMSAFTGETGAGKSLLIDAIGILRGDRINASMVKQGKDKAVIEGVFHISDRHPSRKILEEAGYELEDDMIIIQREFNKDGKSVSRMNHRTTTVSLIKEVLLTLIDIHSQHDSQYLLNTKHHLSLFDSFCKEDELLEVVKQQYQTYQHVHKELQAALLNEYNEEDLEYLTFQIEEIDQADIKEGELEALEQEQKKMMAFEKISTNLNQVNELLHGDQGATTSIYEACRLLESIHEDDAIVEVHDELLDLYYTLDEKQAFLYSYMETLEFDEARANEISERLFLIHKIMRKYGKSVAEIASKRQEFENRVDVILHRNDYLAKQEKKEKEAYDSFLVNAKKLHAIRVTKAKELEVLIVQQLRDLHLEHAQFSVSFEEIHGNMHGIDQIEFLISMNKGEALKSLATTASGGELSRLMLGLKTIFTKLQGIETVIFDEIDTGVSGSVAFAIGKKMQELSNVTQVFCVTHLAQVAACAHHQYLVVKHQDQQSTTTTIQLLEEAMRIQQLALISSDSTSDVAIQAAKELYRKAQDIGKN